jgi:hypothetical protein
VVRKRTMVMVMVVMEGRWAGGGGGEGGWFEMRLRKKIKNQMVKEWRRRFGMWNCDLK